MCILPEKGIPEVTYTVSGGTLNPTHSLSLFQVLTYFSYALSFFWAGCGLTARRCETDRCDVLLTGVVDLLSTDFDVDKDDITLLNEILSTNTPAATSSSEFSTEWNTAFGTTAAATTTSSLITPSPTDTTESRMTADFFMPSSLLDMTAGNFSSLR